MVTMPYHRTCTNPFKVDISDFMSSTDESCYYYIPGMMYSITFSGQKSETFIGFMIQGHEMSTHMPVGEFIDPEVSILKGCGLHTVGITHNRTGMPTGGYKNLEYTWKAPSAGTGNIVFRYTVAKSGQLFWADARTDTIHEGDCSSNNGSRAAATLSAIAVVLSSVIYILAAA